MAVQHDRVRFGAAYYYEYAGPGQDPKPETLERDLDLMAAAAFSVIRVGESVWSTWEPEDGRFELEWLQPVLDGAHARGIDVILGTPTYARAAVAGPAGTRRSPASGAHRAADRLGRPAGGRLHPPGLPVPRRAGHPRRSSAATPDHPAVIGFQVDNEPGQRAAAQPRRLPAVRGPSARHVRRRRDPQPRVGPRLLVAPALAPGRTCGPRTATPSPSTTSPGGAFQAAADHRVHRLAGRHRPRVRPRGPVRHHVHLLRPARVRRRRARPHASTSPPATRTTPCRTRWRCPTATTPTSPALDDHRRVGAVPDARPDVLRRGRRRSW